MNKKNGFTLVELLAVIAILAILVIISLPNIMKMFNESKERIFSNELKNIYRGVQQQWINDIAFNSGERVYASSSDEVCSNKLNLDGGKGINYYIKVDSRGNVIEYYASNGTFQYSYKGNITINDLDKIQIVSNLQDYEIIKIDCNGATHPEKPHTCISFSEDSWSTIHENVVDGYTNCYHVGDIKNIEITDLGTYTVRISNMSNPDVCSSENFSQTACGFVIEFQDIILKSKFNTTNSSSGGWRDSYVRNYLNVELFNKLPNELKNVISSTIVVSGHEKDVMDNYVTNDKLYLIATGELWQKTGTDDIKYDSADTLTRQLDYYASIPVTSNSCNGAIKKYNGVATLWWLRSAHKTSNNYIGNVQSNGKTNAYYGHASLVYGISPAFKIN